MALLLTRGMAGSAVDLEGVTALYLAARDGSEELINLLIDNGAEIAAKDNLGRTPLHYCAESGHGAATRLLVDGIAVGHCRSYLHIQLITSAVSNYKSPSNPIPSLKLLT